LDSDDRLGRLLRIAIALVLVAIPLRIVALGWMPRDDVRRHVAKAASGKEWSEIVLLRPGAELDLHAGWHELLEVAHAAGASTPRALAILSVVALAGAFFLAPLPWLRRAEAWPLALLAVALFEPIFFPRLLSGRPLVLAMTVLVLLLLDWRRFQAERMPWRRFALWAALFALVSWAHGNWYLWLLPLALFFVAGERRAGGRLAAAWALGTVAGAALTGHPFAFLGQWLATLYWSFGSHDSMRQLATEFQPGQGAAALLLAVLLLVALRRRPGEQSLLADPVFLLAVTGWLLGLAVSRFWSDWGLPALLVWGARELEATLERNARAPRTRLLLAGFATMALFLALTGNRGDRWSQADEGRHLRYDEPALRRWLPDEGGILYANSMGLFYDTFFENPRAPFRYAVGFEPGLMPEDDLTIFRDIQRRGASDAAFLPWVAKLRPNDRIAVARPGGQPPQIPGMEWAEAWPGLWLGRPAGQSQTAAP
jgi:hypothetical protein